MSRRPTVGPGYVRFRTARERDAVARIAGWPQDSKLRGRSFDVYSDIGPVPRNPRPLSLSDSHPVVSRGSDVLRELRAGRSWPGNMVNGYRLRTHWMPASGRTMVTFGCWNDYLDQARAVLEAAERAARRKRPVAAGTPTFAGRPASFTSAGTTLLHKYRSSPTTEDHAVRIPLRHLRVLVAEAERAAGHRTYSP